MSCYSYGVSFQPVHAGAKRKWRKKTASDAAREYGPARASGGTRNANRGLLWTERVRGVLPLCWAGVKAHVAQLAEHVLGKDEVSGSIPLMGSRSPRYD